MMYGFLYLSVFIILSVNIAINTALTHDEEEHIEHLYKQIDAIKNNSKSNTKKKYINSMTGEEFPTYVPLIGKREHDGEIVTRGRFELLGGLTSNKNRNRVSLNEFKRILQCAPSQPVLHERMQFLKLLPLTKKNVELMSVYFEDNNDCHSWKDCAEVISKYKNGEGPNRLGGSILTSPSQSRMLRIKNNKLYVDFPWKLERFKDAPPNAVTVTNPVKLILEMTTLPDALWLHAEEYSLLDFHVPFPTFSSSPSYKPGSLCWPWHKEILEETRLYSSMATKKDFKNVHHYTHDNIIQKWNNRVDMAAFYGALTPARQVFFDIAGLYPNEFVAKATYFAEYTRAWNPSSTEESPLDYVQVRGSSKMIENEQNTQYLHENHTGYLNNYLKNMLGIQKVHYWLDYKYVVVLLGSNGLATADRLAWFLAHSGAVVLLQTPYLYSYTFSNRLIPYVHYVPISYTGGDLIEKIQWLRENDDLAIRIVENAKTFGASYLRLEDHFCYMTQALEAVSELGKGSDVLDLFHDDYTIEL